MENPVRLATSVLALTLALLHVWPAPARACGGFFCSAAPVDQNAERIVFAVDEANQRTHMIVQITYQGEDDAFAWLLPVAAVPEDRQVFPNGALEPLDAQTGPSFVPPPQCGGWGVPASSRGDDESAEDGGNGVTVHVRETVGPFDVSVIQSASSEASFSWLIENGYRLSAVMKPYLELYTQQQMKFLALKLTADASAKDIQPFRMSLPGTTPSVPLRLTAIAAEPEMGVLVWILGQRRYEPANAEEIAIPKAELRWRADGWPIRTNWTELVARHVDAHGGRGWVVEQAGPTADLVSFLQSTFTSDPDQEAARDALLELFAGRPYMTRLYTRVAAEEMSYDPSFKQSDKGDVPRQRDLPYDARICRADDPPEYDECDFAACGQLGLCRAAMDPSSKRQVAACACAPGSTARTTFDAQGLPVVTCQDQRMSFMNPGESDETGAKLADPCVGYNCGEHGQCVAMNLTPTCVCDPGFVAVGGLDAAGKRLTQCVAPMEAVPNSFYNRRPPQLATGMVAGRDVPLPAVEGNADVPMPPVYGEPRPAAPASNESDGCALAPGRAAGPGWLALGSLVWLIGRRRTRRGSARRHRRADTRTNLRDA